MDEVVAKLDGLVRDARYGDVERASRELLAANRFYLWHLYLILALLRTGRKDEAGRELDLLFTYKFNIGERAWPEIKAAFPEKFAGHFILSTMKPEASFEAQPSVRRRWDVPYPLAERAAFDAVVDGLVEASMPALPLLARSSARITTFGSCFAANLARILRGTGVQANNLLIEESINSPLANRLFLEAVTDPERSAFAARVRESFGAQFLADAKARLAQADVLVLTLGVAPGFFHRDTGAFSFLEDYRALLAAGRLVMRTPSTTETKAVLADTLALLRGLNARARLYVTVSPVPLMGTAEFPHAVLADTVSKSTLRVAIHEVLAESGPENVHYWPSFEVVRWLSGHTALAVYGADDGNSRHVSDWAVALIVDRFSRHLFGAA